MRKLVHEEVDREIANKSVNIAIKMLKPELDQLMKGLREAVQAPVKAAGKAAVNKIHPTTGKQSVKTLIRQGQGVSSIPLADEGLKDFQKIAKKYGDSWLPCALIPFTAMNSATFTVISSLGSAPFSLAKDTDAITRILQDYSAKQVKKPSVEKTSVLEKLKKFKEIVAAIPKKVAEKKKERSR